MMKRIGALLCLVLVTVMMCSSFCFAAGTDFSVEKTYPADGDSNKSIDNFGIKFYFNQPVLNEKNVKHNSKCIKVTDEEGNELPVTLYYSPKEEGLAMALVEPENHSLVKQDTLYTVTLSSDFVSADGQTLGEDVSVSFKTLNQTRSTTVNMIMMGVMMVGMIFFSTKAMKQDAGESASGQHSEKKGSQKVNPYKEAKKTGKSVQEVVEKDQKDKAKRAEKNAKKEAKAEAEREAAREKLIKKGEIAEETETGFGVKKVHGKRPISAAGGKYHPKK